MQHTNIPIRRGAAASLLLMAALLLGSCGDEILTVGVARIEVSPPNASVRSGQTTTLTARLLSPEGEALSGRTVQWRSLEPAIATVDANGVVRGVSRGTTTIEASTDGVSGTAAVAVTTGPVIVLSQDEVEFSAVWNGATPGDRTVNVQNGGDGTLNGLAASVRYAQGDPSGWLTATVGATAPSSLVLSARPGTLQPGTYSALVDVSSPEATGAATLAARLVVLAPAPAIALGTTAVALSRSVGGPEPAERTVAVTNAGGGSLSGLVVAVTHAAGQPTGWLTATLTGTSAPTSIVLRTATGSLAPGTYAATVQVASASAQNSPQQVAVTLTVSGAEPAINLSASTLAFEARRNAPAPAAATVEITNAGGGTLAGLVTSVTYPGGQPAGWLSLSLGATAAPTTLGVAVRHAELPAGRYSATITVASPSATNSPRQVGVTLDVAEAAAFIVATPSSVTFTGSGTGGDPAPVEVALTNGGGGTVTGLAATVEYAQPGSSWLSAALDGTAAPARLTLNATRAGLGVGSHAATVRITADNAATLEVPVVFTIATAPPVAPTAPSTSGVRHDRITVSWQDASNNEDRFEIERSSDAGANWTASFTAPANSTSYGDDGLSSSTTYTYRVRACNAAGCSSFSPLVSATTAPEPPSELRATAASPTRVDLSWTDNSADETGFVVERSTDGQNWGVVATVPANVTAHSDSPVSSSTTYSYRVSACRSGTCSGPGNVAQVATPTGLAAPSSLTATAASSSRIDLSWTDNSTTESEFRVEARTGSASFQQVGTTAANQASFAHTGLAAGTTYEYRVRACDAAGCSAYSGTASATTDAAAPLAPGAPSSLQAAAAGPSQVDLSWSASSGIVTTYHVERSTSATSGFAEVGSVTGTQTSFQDTGLSGGTTYYYRVRASNITGSSPYSPTASATTSVAAPAAPSDLSASAASSSRIDLSWADNSTTESEFRVEARTGSASFQQVGTTAANQASFAHTGLTAGTTYEYRVRACNAAGCSAYSGSASATTHAQAPQAPATPTGFAVTGTTVSSISLGWSHGGEPAADRFEIERADGSTPDSFSSLASPVGTARSLTDSQLPAGSTFLYRIRACSGTSCSGWTGVSGTTDAPSGTPPTPSSVSATALSPTQVEVSWSAVTGQTHYEVRRRQGTGGGWGDPMTVSGQSTSLVDTVPAGSTHQYQVRACAGSSCSDFTGPVTVTTPSA